MVYMLLLLNFVSQIHHQDKILAIWTNRSDSKNYDNNVCYINEGMQFVFLQFTLGSDLYFTSYSDDDKKAPHGNKLYAHHIKTVVRYWEFGLQNKSIFVDVSNINRTYFNFKFHTCATGFYFLHSHSRKHEQKQIS